jgi:hypothetical protein
MTKKKIVEKPKVIEKPKTIIWKDKSPVKTKKDDTGKSKATDSNEGDHSPMSSMRMERLSRKRKRIHPGRQPSRLLRASGKRG